MKKTIAVFVVAMLVALVVSFGAGNVANASGTKLTPPTNVNVAENGGNYYLTFENVPGNNGYEIVVDGVKTTVQKDENRVQIEVERGKEIPIEIKAIAIDRAFDSDYFKTTIVVGLALARPERLSVTADKSLTFDEVAGAVSYDVVINAVKVETGVTSTQIPLKDILISPMQYEIKVRANGDNRLTYDSNFATLVYENVLALEKVENASVAVDGGRVILSFDKVPYACGYEIEINGKIIETTNNAYDLTDKVAVPANYEIKVRAIGADGFSESEWTSITYETHKTIEKPSMSIENTVVSWDRTDGANEYAVTVQHNGKEIRSVERFSDNKIDIADLVTAHGVGEYIVTVQALANGNYDYSDVATIAYRKYEKLSVPEVTMDGTVAKWNAVENAENYTVKIDGRIINALLDKTSFDVYEYIAEAKTYEVAVTANAKEWYLASDEGKTIYKLIIALSSPVLTISENIANWTSVLGATEYLVFIDGEKVLSTQDTTADLTKFLKDGENIVKVVAVANGFSDGISNEVVVIKSAEEEPQSAQKTYKIDIPDEEIYVVFLDGKRTEYKIANKELTIPSSAKKLIIVPEITSVPEGIDERREKMASFYEEIDLSVITSDKIEITTAMCGEKCYADLIDIKDGENEIDFYEEDGRKFYYLNENGKYRPKKEGEE